MTDHTDLISRLRGVYPIGPIKENGQPEFGYRQFDPKGEFLPAIQKEAADALEAQAARIAELEAGWQPIETAPHNDHVLLFCPDRGCQSNRERIEMGCASHGWQRGSISNISHHPWATHWMHLPQPPKGGE